MSDNSLSKDHLSYSRPPSHSQWQLYCSAFECLSVATPCRPKGYGITAGEGAIAYCGNSATLIGVFDRDIGLTDQRGGHRQNTGPLVLC